jgi:transcriptional regulator with XRE-family HTH domain
MDAERFRQIREIRGFSKRKLSQLTGISEMQLIRYEAGTNDPSNENLKLLASALGVTTDYLLGISNNPNGNFSDDELSSAEQQMVMTFRREGWAGVLKMGVHEVTNK